MIHFRHRATGKTALVQKLPRGLLVAQFDDIQHHHSHGWHLYFRRDFKAIRYEKRRT